MQALPCVGPRFRRRRHLERRSRMKSKTVATMNRMITSKWGGRSSAIPLLRIATDPRTWVVAGAAAAAGGRALSRWLTRFDLRGRTVLLIGGKLSVPHLLPYSSSKFALVGLSEGLRAELRASGILVTTVCPGLMRTGSARHASFKGRHDAEYTWFNLADNFPLLSMDVERAARRILNAVRNGNSHVVLSLPAKVADKVHGLFPGLTDDAPALANRSLASTEKHEHGVAGQHGRPLVSVPWPGAP